MKREQRYIVLKVSDLNDANLSPHDWTQLNYLQEKLANHRKNAGKQPLECVVVENDWPEYEAVWGAVEALAEAEKETDTAPLQIDPSHPRARFMEVIVDGKPCSLVKSVFPSYRSIIVYTGSTSGSGWKTQVEHPASCIVRDIETGEIYAQW